MACRCHGKNGVSVERTSAYDQCTSCARKHIKSAWSKWGEFTYEEDNRDYCSAQLRDAADHLKYEHRETALKCRDLAMVIEENRDAGFGNIAVALDSLRIESRNLFYADHPEAKRRLEELSNG